MFAQIYLCCRYKIAFIFFRLQTDENKYNFVHNQTRICCVHQSCGNNMFLKFIQFLYTAP